MFDRQVQEKFKRKTKVPEDLSWHRDQPDRFLTAAIDARGGPANALDLGCGSEFFSPELKELKYEQQLMTGIPLPIGPTVQGQGFWFRRP